MYNLSSHEGQILGNDKHYLFQAYNFPGSYFFDLSKLMAKGKGFESSKEEKRQIFDSLIKQTKNIQWEMEKRFERRELGTASI